tara:strand:- start:181 stop:618 length:438 start_codon:yes stop_codon:yes gene_type:complete
MPIVGFNFDKIISERKAPLQKGMQAKHNIVIPSIKEEDLKVEEKSTKKGLRFNFEFTVDYEPKIGNISINGHILYLDEDKKIKEILDTWNKSKKLIPEITESIINTTIVRCSIKALSLSQEVNLPPHLQLPVIKQAPSNVKDYIG